MEQPMDFAATASVQTQFELDVRGYFSSFKRPSFTDILKAVLLAFPGDGGVLVREGVGRLNGTYKIFTTSQPPEPVVKLLRKKMGQEGTEVISVPLTPPTQHRARARDGLLITIVDADYGPNHALLGKAFDAVLGEYGSIERATESQKYKGTSVHNGNRFCVIKPHTGKELPDRIMVNEISFLVKYSGKKWNCSSCKTEHVGPCPYKKMLYAARDKRNASNISHHVVSDSTLRHADQSGVRADISVMSGATLGQLANAVATDDDVERHCHVVFAAGANDTRVGELDNDHTIVKRLDRSIDAMMALVNEDENRKFYLMNTAKPLADPTRRQFIAHEYFDMRLRKLASYTENFDLIKTPVDDEGWGDDGHPTQELTHQMLLAVTAELGDDILIEPMAITSDRMYRGVISHYLSGCSGCREMGLFEEGGFCEKCVASMTSKKKLKDEKLFKKLLNMALDRYPNTGKRHLSSSDEDGKQTPKKQS